MVEPPTNADRPPRGSRRWYRWRFGIVWHLALSFAAVGVLAALANIIVEQGASIIEVTRIAFVPVDEERDEPEHPQSSDAMRSDLVEALDRYSEAIEARAQIYNADNEARLETARADLAARVSGLSEEPNAEARQELERVLGRYRDSGSALVGVADERRERAARYAEQLRALHDLLEHSVNGGWRIFGRVVARQPVLRLRAEHDLLRSAFAAVTASDWLDALAVASLMQREDSFDATLTENERGLIRSEGREWVSNVRSRFHQLVALRAALVIDAERLADAQRAFAETGERAKTRADAFRALELAGARPANSGAVFVGPPVIVEPFVGPLMPGMPAYIGPPILDASAIGSVAAPQTRVSRQADAKTRRLVAWVSAAVLLIVLIISIGTVRNIVVPIRRLQRATNELGKHGTHEPVPRGGIKELDTLAQSFNRMAGELVEARRVASEQQLMLEQRVRERTRELQQLAECDPLTGLPNRRHLLSLLEAALAAAGQGHERVAVFFLDLDNFKNINDSMGHGFGDEVLKSIAKRLKEISASVGFAGRLGGDEFTVILTGAESVETIWATGLKVIEAFQKPLSIGNRDLIISVSVGASIYPDHERTAEGLLKAADAALFRAKALGRSQISVYTPELLAEAATRFATEQGLRQAVERGDFELVFQPEVSAETLDTPLVEALVRWRMPNGRLASPGEFFAVAEESGLITEIGDWVLRSAVKTTAEWHHGAWPQARVAINVSPRQLIDHRFVENLQALLAEFEVPAHCIEIELTETVLQTGRATIETLHQLHSLGFAIALDDFGSGYASLASLEKLPFTRIKLDRSLIAGIATSSRSAAIAKAIVRLCHDLALEVTAEGVETHEQLRILVGHRPIHLQGHLLSKPVHANELVSTLTRLAHDVPLLLAATRRDLDPLHAVPVPKARAATRKS